MRALLLCFVIWLAGGTVSSAQTTRTDVRTVEIPVRSSYVLTALKRHATLHLKITDCRGAVRQDFAFLYFRDLQVDGTNAEDASKLKEILPRSGFTRLSAQLPDSLFSAGGKLCGELLGGSMIGVKLPKYEVEIIP